MKRLQISLFMTVLVLSVLLTVVMPVQVSASGFSALFTQGLLEPSIPVETKLADDQETAQALAEIYRKSLIRYGTLNENQVICSAEFDDDREIWVFLIADPLDDDLRATSWLMGVSAKTGEYMGLSPQNIASLMYWIVMKSADYLDKDQIFKLVTEHRNELMDYISRGDYTDLPALEGIQRVSVLPGSACVCFDCGGFGLIPNTHSFGFYYTPDGNPVSVEMCMTEDLQPMEKGMGWQQENGDNTYYTEEITDHFFYYETQY